MKNIVFALLLFTSLSVNAKKCEQESDNIGAGECYLEQTDVQVNEAYNALIKALNTKNEAIEAVKQAQEDWLKFRDSNCAFISSITSGEAVNSVGSLLNCKVNFNVARINMLKKFAKGAGKGIKFKPLQWT